MSVLADKATDDAMAADWAAIQDKYKVEDEAPEPEKEVKEETIPVSREADGKFKARDSKEAKPKDEKPEKVATDKQEPVTKAEPTKETKVEVEENSTPARDINRAPSTWKPLARAEFDKLSPAIKAEIHRRESDFQNGQAQLIPDATLGKELRAVIDPYRAMIEAEGGTPARAVADLFKTAAIFRTGTVQQKYQAVAQLANQFGLDLKRFGGQQPQVANGNPTPPQTPQEFRDPRVDQLLAQRTEEQQREAQQLETAVNRWIGESDAEGNPKRAYLSDVINEMSALVPQIKQSDPTLSHIQVLEAAYDRAIWAHPEIRTLLAQKQQSELDAQRKADNQQKVREAKRAGSVNVARRASVPVSGKPGTMDETLANTARELGFIS